MSQTGTPDEEKGEAGRVSIAPVPQYCGGGDTGERAEAEQQEIAAPPAVPPKKRRPRQRTAAPSRS